MKLWVHEPCEHGETAEHRAPDENSYLSWIICDGGYSRKASPAELVAAVKQLQEAVAVAWCVVHQDLDTARQGTEDVRQVCGGSEFWATGERGDCEFTDAVVVPQ